MSWVALLLHSIKTNRSLIASAWLGIGPKSKIHCEDALKYYKSHIVKIDLSTQNQNFKYSTNFNSEVCASELLENINISLLFTAASGSWTSDYIQNHIEKVKSISIKMYNYKCICIDVLYLFLFIDLWKLLNLPLQQTLHV